MTVFLVGVLLGILGRCRGSLLIAMVAHVTVNTTGFGLAFVDAQRPKAWLGVGATPQVEDGVTYMVLTSVEARSPAANAGLQVGDGRYTMGGYGMPSTFRAFEGSVRSMTVGDDVEVVFRRDGRLFKTTVSLGARPPPRHPGAEGPD